MRTWLFVDRSGWGEGGWNSEPDKAQWRDEDTGLICIARRGPSGAWCGYVGVGTSNRLYNVDYVDCPYLRVHGGITYAALCMAGDESQSICHKPESGDDDLWWFGFDCAHSGDYMPDIAAHVNGHSFSHLFTDDIYRTLVYVQKECADLAHQLCKFEGTNHD